MACSLGFAKITNVVGNVCSACLPGCNVGRLFARVGDVLVDHALFSVNKRVAIHRMAAGFYTFVSLFLSQFVFSQCANAEPYTIHAGPNGYAPFFIVNKVGETTDYAGAMYDLLDMFERRYPEYTRESTLLTRKRANIMMARGEAIDVMFNSPLFVSEKIKEHYKFTRPIFRARDVVITLQENEFEYTKPEDLYGKMVGTIRGYGYGQFDQLLEDGLIRDIRVDEHKQAIGMLVRGRVDAYFGNALVSPHYIKQLGLEVSDFKFSSVSMYEFDLGFAVNNKRPELYEKLNKFLDDVKFNGVLDRLMQSYLE